MLQNKHHPGPGCSCDDCLRDFTEPEICDHVWVEVGPDDDPYQVCDECGERKPEVCERCHGTGLVTISYGGDGYGNRCAATADADDQPCPDCTP